VTVAVGAAHPAAASDRSVQGHNNELRNQRIEPCTAARANSFLPQFVVVFSWAIVHRRTV
jgi:hypothetical protein